jgi:hypothetical protein
MVEAVAGIARGSQYRGRSLRATVASARVREMTVHVTRRAARVFVVVAQALST